MCKFAMVYIEYTGKVLCVIVTSAHADRLDWEGVVCDSQLHQLMLVDLTEEVWCVIVSYISSRWST